MSPSRRTLLLGAALAPVAALPVQAGSSSADNPDAELIEACRQHRIIFEGLAATEGDDDPLWDDYDDVCETIGDTEAQTIQGIVAKARAAVLAAGDDEDWAHTIAHEWAADLMHDLIRLHG